MLDKKVDISQMFEDFHSEYLEFGRIENPKHLRPDICAFLMLDEICPGDKDIIDGSEREEIFLSIDIEEFVEKVTEDQFRDLIRCGLRYDPSYQCLAMFA